MSTNTPSKNSPIAAAEGEEKTPEAHVLVVDDNRDIVRVIRRILNTQNYRISEASDGEQALSLAREHLPDLILLDVMLPKKDGLDVCRELKSDPATAGIMIILVTGRASVDHRVQGFEAGADDYVPKPFHVPELLARTRTALRLKNLTDDLEKRNHQLIKSQNDLIRSEKMATIGLLASGIAHEFNNIMAGISAYAQLARKDPSHRESLVDVALTQTSRALELTRSLSTYNRTNVSEGHCDAVTVIEGALCLVAKEIEKRGARVSTEWEGNARVAVRPGQLQEVVLNLVLNAVHAVKEGEGRIAVKAAPSPDPKMLEIEVADNGDGIPEQNRERIFDPFFTTKGALGGGNAQGTGLGLAVCYNIVNAHRGKLDLTSTMGKGTTFRVTLPRHAGTTNEESGEEIDAESNSSTAATPTSEKLRVLVVDGEEPPHGSLREFFSAHEVRYCSGVEDAIESYSAQPFDYVILDVCIPGSINGFAAFDRFQHFDPPPRIIFSSGHFPDETFQKYIVRAHGHLLKPFKLEDLAELLGVQWEPTSAGSQA